MSDAAPAPARPPRRRNPAGRRVLVGFGVILCILLVLVGRRGFAGAAVARGQGRRRSFCNLDDQQTGLPEQHSRRDHENTVEWRISHFQCSGGDNKAERRSDPEYLNETRSVHCSLPMISWSRIQALPLVTAPVNGL